MAHGNNNNGSARSVSTQDFNERVKRALVDKHDPQPKAKPAPRRFRTGAPNSAD
ncbi:hypothetical protein [Methylorubrum salsuginis]|uniref:Uncharacterized protein n=1 Tax=Methylorubrum salsuginis TaxID=414703 RepID=A0A1I4MTP8_9HYPH|nr:hypothetical protein [Methylorubrum salsuginis]SFM06629.1 hypothetical protein SAMN04488125_1447 [Methylorubrum salsuginis]